MDRFFTAMPEEVRKGIVAVASDMWKSRRGGTIKKWADAHPSGWCPGVKVVFDLFHLVKDFNQIIDKIRNEEYRKADEAGKAVLKGAKYAYALIRVFCLRTGNISKKER